MDLIERDAVQLQPARTGALTLLDHGWERRDREDFAGHRDVGALVAERFAEDPLAFAPSIYLGRVEQRHPQGKSSPHDFSLAQPDALDDLVPFAERENRIVIAYSPLAQGLLGGKYSLDNRPGNGVRAVNPLFGTENLRRAEPLLKTLRDVAREAGAKPAQLALAWLISLPGVLAIPRASSVDQLESSVAAADIELITESRNALTDAARAFRPVPRADRR